MNAGQGAAWLLAGLILLLASRRLPWHKVRGDAEAQRVFAIATVAFAAMRWLNTDVIPGVSLHFLGASIATLMFGARFALWSMAVASALAALGGHAWLGWGPDFLASGALPVAITHLWGVAARRLPPNFFAYVMVDAFFAAAAAMAGSTLCKALVSHWLQSQAADAYLIATLPLMFGEAFFTGGTMALVVVYRPHWCASFDDARYLQGR